MDEMLIPKLNESEHTLNDTSHHWRLHEGNFFFLEWRNMFVYISSCFTYGKFIEVWIRTKSIGMWRAKITWAKSASW